MAEQAPLVGKPASESELMWLELGRSLAKNSIEAIESTAKNLVAGIAVLEGLYFNAVSFEHIQTRITDIQTKLGWDRLFLSALFAAPLLLWLLAVVYATLALTVKRHDLHLDSPDLLKRELETIAAAKYARVQTSLWLLVAGLVLLLVNLFVYLAG